MSPPPRNVGVPPPHTLRAVRVGLRLLSFVAPRAASRGAASLFLRPRRRPTRPPEVPNLHARPFAIGEGEARVQCWSWGAEDQPTVLLVHGWEGHSGQLARFIPPLLERGFRVVAFDLPAHGHSAGRSTHLVDGYHTLLRIGATLGPLHGVIAHSFGASVTILALAHGLVAKRVALFAATADPMLFIERLGSALGLSPRRLDGVLVDLRRRVGADLRDLDLRTQARRIDVPALVLHDREDTEVPLAHGEAIVEAWRGARLETLEGLGHWRVLKDPKSIALAVDFVTGDARATRGGDRSGSGDAVGHRGGEELGRAKSG